MTARRRTIAITLAAAVTAYVPLLLSSPGRVGADTKSYLYLDPGRLLRDASSMWDSDVALGTVTHQNIGYLWPMGPFYWVFDALGSPDWIAQRLWLGTLLFAAGMGVWFLLRTLGWSGAGLLVAMLAYELSPYLLDYSARISAVLLPWAGLPWLIALTIRAARSGGWRHPALFALVVLTVGSVNATSLLLVGLAPVLWLLHVTFIEKSLAVADMVRTALRIGLLTVGVSLWWVAGLTAQGAYSLPVTRYTETYEVVADASTAPEILRGLGYWFFYGNDKFGQWIEPSVEYTQGLWLVFLSFGLVVFALGSVAVVRWRHQGYFLLLLVVGALIGIGAHPFDAPSPLGRLFRDFTRTDAGLAIRSTPRAGPMLILATAVLLGAAANAAHRRWPVRARPFVVLLLVAIVLNNPAMWRTRMIESNLDRDEDVPDYWLEAIDRLDEVDDGTRVLEVPGSDFASYRWGNTVDPITPGLMDRGYVARELVPFGSAESAALVTAFDRRLQEDSLDLDSVAPIVRLMSVGDVVHRADLTYERFRTPRPVPFAHLLDSTPGLGASESFGAAVANVAGPQQTMLDEVELGIDPSLPDPSPVTRYPVDNPLPVVRVRRADNPIVIIGDADGLVDAAGAELIDTDRTVLFAGDLLADEEVFDRALASEASIVVTDSNRKRARRWGTLRENVGYTERAGEEPLTYDPTDNRLPVFPELESLRGLDVDDTRTVSVQEGPFVVQASDYGNPVTYTSDDRAFYSVDGRVDTAWSVAAFAEPRGEFLRFTYDEPVTLEHITFVQPQPDIANRHVTEVRVSADDADVATVALDARSRGAEGQRFELSSAATGSVWDIEITDVDFPRQPTYGGVSPVGFAEVRLGETTGAVSETIRTPRALLDVLGADLDRHDLSVVLTRERSNPAEPVREDPETAMRRVVPLPTPREFTIEGAARLSAGASEATIDALLGRSAGSDGVALTARSSGSLAGDLNSIASSAFDGSPSTAWTGRFGPQAGQSVTVERAEPAPIDGIRVQVVADDLHSVPTALRVWADGADLGEFPTGMALTDAAPGTTREVVLPVSSTATTLTIEVVRADERLTRDWYSNSFTAMPVAIAEAGAGGPFRFREPQDLDGECREDLVTLDGQPIAVRIDGSAADAMARRELSLIGCGSTLVGAGDVGVTTAAGATTGIDIDQLVLRSPRGLPTVAALEDPTVVDSTDTRYRVRIPASATDRWLVLGQSRNDGWRLTIDGDDQGDASVVDGFANGWLIPAGGQLDVELRWTPQRLVDSTLRISAVFVLLTLVLGWRGRRDTPHPDGERVDGPALPSLGPTPILHVDRSGIVGVRPAVLTAVAVAVVTALNLPQAPWLALGLAGVFYASVRAPRVGSVAPLAAAACLGIATLAIMYEQRRFRRPPDFVWPQQFEEVHILGVLAVLLLLVDYIRGAIAPRGPGSD